jgi:hypothetical protein
LTLQTKQSRHSIWEAINSTGLSRKFTRQDEGPKVHLIDQSIHIRFLEPNAYTPIDFDLSRVTNSCVESDTEVRKEQSGIPSPLGAWYEGLSGPHVHRSPAATTGPWPGAVRRGPCPVGRPRAIAVAGLWPWAARRGPCSADRLGAAAWATPPPRAASRGPCPADIPATLAATGPQPPMAPASARLARFAHSSVRPPFRIWWGQCFGAWHRG